MHFSTFAVAAIAFAATLGNQVVSAQENCNPTFVATPVSDCIKNCKISAGQGFFSEWTLDPASPNFVKSLSYECGKGTPSYTAFMTNAGMCMTSCSAAEQEEYVKEFANNCAWYEEHKTDVCEATGDVTSAGAITSVAVKGCVTAAMAATAYLAL